MAFCEIICSSEDNKKKILIEIKKTDEVLKAADRLSVNPDYSEIERNAYISARKKVAEYMVKTGCKNSRMNELSIPIVKKTVHMYGPFFVMAAAEALCKSIRGLNPEIVSDIHSRGKLNNIIFTNEMTRHKVLRRSIYTLFYTIIKHISFKKTIQTKSDNIIKISTTEQYKLFKYYFPEINDFCIISESGKKTMRIERFKEYCRNTSIQLYEYKRVISLLNGIETLLNFRNTVLRLRTPEDAVIFKAHLDVYLSLLSMSKLIGRSAKLIIMSEEYKPESDILAIIAKRQNAKTINFQHGGIYLGDSLFDKFIVFGEKYKKKYLSDTQMHESQFLVLGNPSYRTSRDENIIDGSGHLKILFVNQYIVGYVTDDIKIKIAEILSSIGLQHSLTIKAHPSENDKIMKDTIKRKDVKYLENGEDFSFSNYDITLSFYSTMLIESVNSGVPSISLNPMGIKGIFILDTGIFPSISDSAALNEILDKLSQNSEFYRGFLHEQKEKCSQLWKADEKDWRIKEIFVKDAVSKKKESLKH